MEDTAREDYTNRLQRKESVAWKRWLDVQRPYRWNLQRLNLGFTLDLGCGLGRNLGHLGGRGVGIDHNATSVAVCRSRGFEAYTPEEFAMSPRSTSGSFDSLLAAHLVEHLPSNDVVPLLREHLRFVRPGGKLVLITPQALGYRSDPTHVQFVDFTVLRSIAEELDVREERCFSFPLPSQIAGRFFTYNEFVLVATLPA